MAAPLSGIGQQNVPISQPFQPTNTDETREVRQQEQDPREEELQAREAAASQSQNLNQPQNGEDQERGSLVDITV